MTFEEFAAAHLPAVLRFAAVLAGDRAAAEDLAQEVLIRAYSRWDRIGGLDRPEFYVRKMLDHLVTGYFTAFPGITGYAGEVGQAAGS